MPNIYWVHNKYVVKVFLLPYMGIALFWKDKQENDDKAFSVEGDWISGGQMDNLFSNFGFYAALQA